MIGLIILGATASVATVVGFTYLDKIENRRWKRRMQRQNFMQKYEVYCDEWKKN